SGQTGYLFNQTGGTQAGVLSSSPVWTTRGNWMSNQTARVLNPDLSSDYRVRILVQQKSPSTTLNSGYTSVTTPGTVIPSVPSLAATALDNIFYGVSVSLPLRVAFNVSMDNVSVTN